jgi:hypothetical protein
MIINSYYPIVRTPNTQNWSMPEVEKFMDDDSLVCGAGSFYPFETSTDFILWRRACSTGAITFDDNDLPAEEFIKCAQAQEVISKEYHQQD